MKKSLFFSQLSNRDLLELSKEKTLFIFPVGGIENHGPHLPMGVDVFVAEKMIARLNDAWTTRHGDWTFVVMPTLSAGVQGESGGFSLTIRPYVLRDWLIDSCMKLLELGFYQFACYSGTFSPRQLTAIEEASKTVQNRGWLKMWRSRFPQRPLQKCVLLSISSVLVEPQKVRNAPFFTVKQEHGGEEDVALASTLGVISIQSKNLPLEVQPPPRKWGTGWFRTFHTQEGYWGAPSKADPQKATILLEPRIQKMIDKMEEVLIKKRNPQFVFRSWYSILPPNQSFFKAWVLFFLFFLLFSAWIALVVQFSFPEI